MRRRRVWVWTIAVIMVASWSAAAATAVPLQSYFRQPALSGDTLVFVSEGDLWRVPASGGMASRLTTHAEIEDSPVISPDGTTVAYTASYEGPTALYTLPIEGGLPTRWTWDDGRPTPAAWTPDGRLGFSTTAYAGLPDPQLVVLSLATSEVERVPLAQASDGSWNPDGTLVFVRYRFQGSRTKRYHGGTAQRLWRLDPGADEAKPLTADWRGTSRDPMWWNDRIVFASDRDGTLNLWSMDRDGGDLRQHTTWTGWDVLGPSIDGSRVVYQLGADIRVHDLRTGDDHVVPIHLASDFDQLREHWIEQPMDYVTAVHLAPDGDRVVLTARGAVFVAPRHQGRFVEATHDEGVRYRDARFMPGGDRLVTLSDASGEVEVWSLPANGVGRPRQMTTDGDVLRWQAIPSPDGKLLAHHDKNYRLWIHDVSSGNDKLIARSERGSWEGLSWSPDSRWLVAVDIAPNLNRVIRLYDVVTGTWVAATTDRYDSTSPVFSRDGKWLAFLSDRHLESVVSSPWGTLQPEPFFDQRTRIFLLDLAGGTRSPFAPADELHPADKDGDHGKDRSDRSDATPDTAKSGKADARPTPSEPPSTVVRAEGLTSRLVPVPAPAANASSLAMNDSAFFWLDRRADERSTASLKSLKLDRLKPEVKTVAAAIRDFELSADGTTLLVRKGKELYVVDATAAEATLDDESKVDLEGWRLAVEPRAEWRQMLTEAWRLERDYFYDTGMHGVDWKGVLERYLPLVDRVHSRDELADLTAQMVAELSAIHTFVYGGDLREDDNDIAVGRLGARLARDTEAGGWRVDHLYRWDPDEPDRRPPLAAFGVDATEGDVIVAIDGVATVDLPDPGVMLRNRVGTQVLLEIRDGNGATREAIVQPISGADEADMRYHEWEYTRRLRVEEASDQRIGYVHLRAMGRDDIAQWARDFYPVHDRQGLIVDVRHNRGGNIDSWIVSRLMRQVWSAWSDRVGLPTSTNMQYAFRGHLVVLCDAWTASDGEAFLEAIRRLDLGPIIGTRTWGGGIWLTSSNRLVDGGIATAAEFGVFGPEGKWLIEADGVSPDIAVDNLPVATFRGEDAQLEAAIQLLLERIATDPIPPLEPPPPKDLALDGEPSSLE